MEPDFDSTDDCIIRCACGWFSSVRWRLALSTAASGIGPEVFSAIVTSKGASVKGKVVDNAFFTSSGCCFSSLCHSRSCFQQIKSTMSTNIRVNNGVDKYWKARAYRKNLVFSCFLVRPGKKDCMIENSVPHCRKLWCRKQTIPNGNSGRKYTNKTT